VFPVLFGLAVLGQSYGETSRVLPVDRAQLVAWLTGGISNSRLARRAAERGVSFTVSAGDEKQLRAVGADSALGKALRTARHGPDSMTRCPPALYKAAERARAKTYAAPAGQLTNLLRSDSENSSLRFALGQMLL